MLNSHLALLKAAGVHLVIELPTAFGVNERDCSVDDVLLFLDDREAFYAKSYGVTMADLRDWADDNYNVICSAMTKKERKCRNIVVGSVSPERWVKRQGEYCALHSGDRLTAS
jgi:hypothetical protein